MSSGLRRLASDTIIYGVSTMVGRLLTFLLTPLYIHAMPQEAYGELVYLYTLIAVANVLMSLGLETAFFRFHDRGQEPNSPQKPALTAAMLLVAIQSAIGVSILILQADNIAGALGIEIGGTTSVMLMAGIIATDVLSLVPFAYLRLERKSRTFALLKLFGISVNIICNILFVWLWNEGLLGAMKAGFISGLASFITVLPFMYKGISPSLPSGHIYKLMLWFGVPTIPSGVSAIALQVADRPILKQLMGDAAVGLYQANYKLAIPMMMFITVFDYAWKPFFLKGTPNREKRKDFQNALIYFTSVAAFLFLTISFYIEPLVTLKIGGFSLLPESYWSGLHIIPIVLAGYIANGFVTHLTIGIYFRKKTAYLPLITGVAALTNIGCLYLFVPTMGITGAAWATLVAYVVAAGGGYFFSRRLYPLRYNYVAIGKILLVTILLYSVSLSIPDLPWWGITLQTGLMLLFLPALAFSGVEEIAHGGRILRSYWAKRRKI